ncbi:hypothetical protein ACIQNU_15855 [Streptomyces sp. NPDC091292]|uniref:hypothetical protein n=1 Tax=Streptomyces sp. NPDC091292 TaxID=3365991 RepID=UPI0037F55584
MTSKALMWAGVGLCAAGAVTLVVVAVVDLGRADQTASVTGGVVALVGLALALYAQFGARAPEPTVHAAGERSIAAGGNIGSATTGDGATPGTPPPPSPSPGPTSTPPPGGVSASGPRSIAAGGDIGTASTGDA